jgi:hypothetical protein
MDGYFFQLYLPGSQFAQDVNFQTKNCSAAEQVRKYIKNPHIYFKNARIRSLRVMIDIERWLSLFSIPTMGGGGGGGRAHIRTKSLRAIY